MGRKPSVAASEIILTSSSPGGPVDEQIGPADEQDEEIADRFRAAIVDAPDQRWRCVVFKLPDPANKTRRKEAYCFEVQPDEFEAIEQRLIAENFGDGEYRIRIWRAGRVWGQKDLSICMPPKAPTAPEANETQLEKIIGPVMKMIEDQNQRMERFLERQATTPAPVADPLAMLDRVLSITQKMNPPPVAASTSTKEIMDAFQSGISIARELGSGDGSATLIDAGVKLMESPVVLEVVKSLTARKSTPTPSASPGPAPAIAAPSQSSPAQDRPAPTQEQTSAFIQGVKFLVRRAKAGDDPRDYAGMVHNMVPPGDRETIFAENFLDRLCKSVPDAEPFRDWFGELVEEVKAIDDDINNAALQGDGDEEVEEEQTPEQMAAE